MTASTHKHTNTHTHTQTHTHTHTYTHTQTHTHTYTHTHKYTHTHARSLMHALTFLCRLLSLLLLLLRGTPDAFFGLTHGNTKKEGTLNEQLDAGLGVGYATCINNIAPGCMRLRAEHQDKQDKHAEISLKHAHEPPCP